MAREKLPLARGNYYRPNYFLLLLFDQRLYIVKYM